MPSGSNPFASIGNPGFCCCDPPCTQNTKFRSILWSDELYPDAPLTVRDATGAGFGLGPVYFSGTTNGSAEKVFANIPMLPDYAAGFDGSTTKFLKASHHASLSFTGSALGWLSLWVEPSGLGDVAYEDESDFAIVSGLATVDDTASPSSGSSATLFSSSAWGGSYQRGSAGTYVATWEFAGLATGGSYPISVSLIPATGAVGVVYTVFDGLATRGTFTVDQTTATIHSTIPDGMGNTVGFHNLGTFLCNSGTLSVRISGLLATGQPVVDACRLSAFQGVSDATAWGDDYAAFGGTGIGEWTFSGLPTADHRVQVSLPDPGRAAADTTVTYKVYDGNSTVGTLLSTQVINQRTVTLDATYDGAKFFRLGEYAIASGTLTVRVEGDAGAIVDACRVEEMVYGGILNKDDEYELTHDGPDVVFAVKDGGGAWVEVRKRYVLENDLWTFLWIDYSPTTKKFSLMVGNATATGFHSTVQTAATSGVHNVGAADFEVGRADGLGFLGAIDEVSSGRPASSGTISSARTMFRNKAQIWDLWPFRVTYGIDHFWTFEEATGADREDLIGSSDLDDDANNVPRVDGLVTHVYRVMDAEVTPVSGDVRHVSRDRVKVRQCVSETFDMILTPILADRLATLTQLDDVGGYCCGPTISGGDHVANFPLVYEEKTSAIQERITWHCWKGTCWVTTMVSTTVSGVTQCYADGPNFVLCGSLINSYCAPWWYWAMHCQPHDWSDERSNLGSGYNSQRAIKLKLTARLAVNGPLMTLAEWSTACTALRDGAEPDPHTTPFLFVLQASPKTDDPLHMLWGFGDSCGYSTPSQPAHIGGAFSVDVHE